MSMGSNMEENILPSVSSARNTQRRINFDLNFKESPIGAVNFQKQKLMDGSFSPSKRLQQSDQPSAQDS